MPDPDPPSQVPDEDATRLIPGGIAAAALAPGIVLGNTYVIEALLGRSAVGEVYRAKHVELGTEHAITIMLPSYANDPKTVQLFHEEARKLGRINSPAIVNYEGFFRDAHGLRYLVTEFVHGESLEQILRRRRLEPNEVLRLRDRLALGLAAAHETDILHRDISPENILLPEGSVDRAKLVGFGIAKSMANSGVTPIGDAFAGKYAFASPEQVGLHGGQVDLRSDIYSLGLVLAAAAIGFGKTLDMGNSPATMLAARQRVPDLTEVPAALRPVIAPMLEPRPDDRPPSMRALSGRVGGEIRTPAGGPAAGASRRRRTMLAIAAAAAAIIFSGGVFFAARILGPSPSTAGLRAELTAATAGYQCASLASTIGADRSVRVSGYAASPDDIAQIRRAVDSIEGVGRLDFAVQLRIWPFCEVAAMLNSLAAHPPRAAPTLALLPTSDAAQLGEPLVVDIRTPSFDSYVYVDYFDRQGQVLHLFPNTKDRLNFRPAQNHLVLGQLPFSRCWVLGGSTGEQLVGLVAAVKPLFQNPRPEVEDARTYLPILSQAVGSLSADRSGAAALRFFELRPAGPFATAQEGCR